MAMKFGKIVFLILCIQGIASQKSMIDTVREFAEDQKSVHYQFQRNYTSHLGLIDQSTQN